MNSDDAQRVAASCMCLSARTLARVLTNRYDDALRPAGLRMTQFTMLTYLRALGPQRIGELARIMGLDQTTASRGAEVLRRDGLLKFARRGRVTTLALTAKGEAALAAAYPLWEAAHRESAAAAGGEAEWLALRGQLAALTSRFG